MLHFLDTVQRAMQECSICRKNLDLYLSSYAEHFRQHERRQEDIKHGTLRCGFCGSSYQSVEKLLQHLVAFHQASEPRMNPSILGLTTPTRSNGSSINQSLIEKSNKVLLLMDKDKKIDAALKNAKEKIVEELRTTIEDYKNNIYISDHLSNEISKSLLETVSTTIQLMANVIKESSLKDYSDKISSIHDEIILSFTGGDIAEDNDAETDDGTSIKQEQLAVLEEINSEFSPPSHILPSTSTTSASTMNATESFDPLPAFNLLLHRPVVKLDSSINVKDGLKKLANDMLDECQQFYDNGIPEESTVFGNVDVYAQFNSPLGRIILYVLFNDTNPEFSKDLITIAWKEAYGILRTILKLDKASLDYRPKDLDPLVNLFLKFIGKEGPNNEILQAETKKILHQWIRTTRHRNKDNNDITATLKVIIPIPPPTQPPPSKRKRKPPSEDSIENVAFQAQSLIPDLSRIVYLFRRTATLRLDWLDNTHSIDIDFVFDTFPVLKMFPKPLIDVDYAELCRNKKWECISIVDEMQRIFPAIKSLLQSYNVTTLPGHLNQNDAFANIFLSFPNLFHHFLNNSKKIPTQFYFESAAQDFVSGVNQIINEQQVQHNFFGRIQTSDGQIIFVYVNGHILRIEGSLLEALEFYYRVHYVFRIERPVSIFFLTSWLDLLCKKKVETNCGPQRFMREIERLSKQYEDFPESRNSEFC